MDIEKGLLVGVTHVVESVVVLSLSHRYLLLPLLPLPIGLLLHLTNPISQGFYLCRRSLAHFMLHGFSLTLQLSGSFRFLLLRLQLLLVKPLPGRDSFPQGVHDGLGVLGDVVKGAGAFVLLGDVPEQALCLKFQTLQLLKLSGRVEGALDLRQSLEDQADLMGNNKRPYQRMREETIRAWIATILGDE